MDAHQYCAEKAAPAGSSVYYSLMFAPPETRPGLCALEAWQIELKAIVYACAEAEIARRKLQWWVDELAQTSAGRPRHPVTQVLGPELERVGLDAHPLARMLTAIAGLLDRDRFATEAELIAFCARTGGEAETLAARLSGVVTPAALRLARTLGTGLELAAQTRPAPGQQQIHRRMIPLAWSGISADHAEAPGHCEALASRLGQRAADASKRLHAGSASPPGPDRAACRSRLILAELVLAYLAALARAGYRSNERKVGVTPLRKLWIAWRVARRERARASRIQA